MYTKSDLSIPVKNEMNLIIGTILGDATLTKSRNSRQTACLRFSHSMKQLDYCQHKSEALQKYSRRGVTTPTYFVKSRNTLYQSARFSTMYTKEFYDLYKWFYPDDKKRIPKNIGKFLNRQTMAYWHMDDGGITKRIEKRDHRIDYKRFEITLHTNGFLKEDIELLAKAIHDSCDIRFTLKKVDYGKHYVLHTKSRKEVQNFVALIRPFTIDSMSYKLAATYDNPMRNQNKYSKNKLLKICRKLQLKRWRDFKKFKNGKRLYESVRWRFGTLDNFRDSLADIASRG